MSQILFLTIIAAGSLAAFRVLQKLAGVSIHPILGTFFIYAGALAAIMIIFLFKPAALVFDASFKKGALIAAVSGIFITIFDVLALTIYQKGGNMSSFTPIVNGGSILIVALVGFLFLRESINLSQFLGVLAVIGGIILLTR